MKPLRRACLVEQGERGVRLECGDGIVCRISFLAPDLSRVLYLRGDRPVAPRTWMVPAHGSADAPWEGRDRLDESAWPKCELRQTANADGIVIATEGMSLTITLAPFAPSWALPDGRVFACERAAHATSLGKSGIRHAFARGYDDRFYGLGDKTGKLDLHGRRLRTAMRDSLGFDPKHGDPLYKQWPFLIARDGASGVASGLFYDNMAAATFDLGCEHDNYYGPHRTYEAPGGDLGYFYVFPGPEIADVTRKFLGLTGLPALPPRWGLGFAQSAMAIADADNAQDQMEALIAKCGIEKIPISAFHFGSGYTSFRGRRYVFTWNRDKYPDPKALMRRFHDAGMRVVANLKPCLLDDHPRYEEVQAAGAFVAGIGGEPAVSQFWDGEGAHIDFTSRAGVDWWRRALREQVLDVGMDAAWNDNNEFGFSNEDAVCAGFGEPMPLDLARPLRAASHDARLARRAAPLGRPWSGSSPSPARACPEFSVMRRPGAATTIRAGARSSGACAPDCKCRCPACSISGTTSAAFPDPRPTPSCSCAGRRRDCCIRVFSMNSWEPDGVFTSPWLHPEATPAIREAIRLRYRLMPYLYSLMHAATKGEAGCVRPLSLIPRISFAPRTATN